MGKRKAARIATMRAGDVDEFKAEVEHLTQMSENLQVLLRRETEKTTALETEVQDLTQKLDQQLSKNSNLETVTLEHSKDKSTKAKKATKKSASKKSSELVEARTAEA